MKLESYWELGTCPLFYCVFLRPCTLPHVGSYPGLSDKAIEEVISNITFKDTKSRLKSKGDRGFSVAAVKSGYVALHWVFINRV